MRNQSCKLAVMMSVRVMELPCALTLRLLSAFRNPERVITYMYWVLLLVMFASVGVVFL